VRSAWTVLKHIIDFLFPILLQLMRFPLFTLRILGDGIVALLRGIARILPIGGERRAAWREFVNQQWAWLRQKISYKAFEEAVHHLFENGMAWVSCCRFHGHRVKVDEGTGGRQWDDDGLIGHSSSRR
jgi:hypothetical protein